MTLLMRSFLSDAVIRHLVCAGVIRTAPTAPRGGARELRRSGALSGPFAPP
jgi:hypothetical protein